MTCFENNTKNYQPRKRGNNFFAILIFVEFFITIPVFTAENEQVLKKPSYILVYMYNVLTVNLTWSKSIRKFFFLFHYVYCLSVCSSVLTLLPIWLLFKNQSASFNPTWFKAFLIRWCAIIPLSSLFKWGAREVPFKGEIIKKIKWSGVF